MYAMDRAAYIEGLNLDGMGRQVGALRLLLGLLGGTGAALRPVAAGVAFRGL